MYFSFLVQIFLVFFKVANYVFGKGSVILVDFCPGCHTHHKIYLIYITLFNISRKNIPSLPHTYQCKILSIQILLWLQPNVPGKEGSICIYLCPACDEHHQHSLQFCVVKMYLFIVLFPTAKFKYFFKVILNLIGTYFTQILTDYKDVYLVNIASVLQCDRMPNTHHYAWYKR